MHSLPRSISITSQMQIARNLVNHLWRSFLELNLYKQWSSDANTIRKEHFATRLYICSLALIIVVIGTTAALVSRTISKTEYSPPHTRFSTLASKYPGTIYCPCSSIGIAFNTFVSTHVRFHQVCSSPFVQQAWIEKVFAEQSNASFSIDDYRATLSFFWQGIAGLCNISQATWTDAVAGFNASHTFHPLAVAERFVRAKVQAALNNAIYTARMTLSHHLLAVQRTLSANQIVSALATNFYLRYPPGDANSTSSPRMSPRTYDSCSCLHSQGCPHPATFNDSHEHLITIPGMIADCLVMDATLVSTLECYYDQSCLTMLHSFPSTAIQPLSNTSNKYFMTNSTVEMLLNELMIDEVLSDIRFDLFYSQCNPAYCSYSYTRRFHVLSVVSTVIGIFGGLSFVLQMIAPLIIAVVFRWKSRCESKNNTSHIEIPLQSRCKLQFSSCEKLSNTLDTLKHTSGSPSGFLFQSVPSSLILQQCETIFDKPSSG